MAVVISFPAPTGTKALGILAGVPLILVLNLVRIVTLYYVGVHFHGFFDTIHEGIWPFALIIATILICAGWIQVARNTADVKG